MAQTEVYSFSALQSMLAHIQDLITSAAAVYARAKTYDDQNRDFLSPSVINTQIGAYVTEAIALLTHATDELLGSDDSGTDLTTKLIHPIRFAAGFPHQLLGFSIDVEYDTDESRITAVGSDSNPAVFGDVDIAVGDGVVISNAEDPDQNGVRAVSAVDLSILTLTSNLPGLDNALDTRMIITLIRDFSI